MKYVWMIRHFDLRLEIEILTMDAGCRVPHPFAYFAKGWETTNLEREARPPGQPALSNAEGRWPHRRCLADYFPLSSHNDPRSLPSNHRPGTSSSRHLASGSGQQRPKLPVTPLPGIFCRELLCFL